MGEIRERGVEMEMHTYVIVGYVYDVGHPGYASCLFSALGAVAVTVGEGGKGMVVSGWEEEDGGLKMEEKGDAVIAARRVGTDGTVQGVWKTGTERETERQLCGGWVEVDLANWRNWTDCWTE